ncbi:hypothetical protein ElyMa_004619400 [Elysia marginata]|uniref:Uncharacterized protein n=1 Tax=Elysia marginata TaxID=1093978 RepID=A0AAV4I2H0_9GAST|nr:hypothetical protein ElyMa_004619400 [Elysia marginata]
MTRNLPPNCEKISNYAMCIATSKSLGREGVVGAQQIGALWRLYPSSQENRIELLTKGIIPEGVLINVSSQNPFLVRGGDGEEIPSTKLTLSDLPLSVANDTVKTALVKKGLKLRSKLKMEGIRDPDGQLTEWLSGRRFVYIDLPKSTIESTLQIGQFKARVYY